MFFLSVFHYLCCEKNWINNEEGLLIVGKKVFKILVKWFFKDKFILVAGFCLFVLSSIMDWTQSLFTELHPQPFLTFYFETVSLSGPGWTWTWDPLASASWCSGEILNQKVASESLWTVFKMEMPLLPLPLDQQGQSSGIVSAGTQVILKHMSVSLTITALEWTTESSGELTHADTEVGGEGGLRACLSDRFSCSAHVAQRTTCWEVCSFSASITICFSLHENEQLRLYLT